MAQNRIVIRGPVVDEWTKAFKDIGSSLKDLKKTLDTVQKQAASFDSIFTSTKNFEVFVKLLREIDDESSKSFRRIGLGFTNLANGLKEFSKVNLSKLKDLPTFLFSLVKGVSDFAVPDIDSGLRELKGLFTALARMGEDLDTDALQGLKDVSNIGSSLFKTINTLDSLANRVAKLDFSNKGFAGVTQRFGQLKPLFSLIREVVQNISKAAGGLDFKPENVLALVEVLKFFATNVKGGIPFNPIIDFVASLSTLADNMPEFRGEGLISRFREFAKLDPVFNLLQVIVKRISKITVRADQTTGLDRITSLVNIFPKLTKLVPKLQEAVKKLPVFRGRVLLNKLRPFARLDPFFALIRRIVRQMSKVAEKAQGDGAGIKNLSKLVRTLENLSNAVPKIIKFASTLKVGTLPNFKDLVKSIQIGRQLGGFINVVKSILRPLDKLAGEFKSVDKLSAIVKVLKTLTEIAETLSQQTYEVPSGFTSFVSNIVKALNPLSGLKINSGQVDKFSASLTGLGDSGQSISKIRGIGSAFSSLGSRIKNQAIDSIVDNIIDSALRGLGELTRGITNFQQNVGRAFTDLSNIIEQGSQRLIDSGSRLFNEFGLQKLLQSGGGQLALQFDDLTKQIGVFAKNIPIEEAQAFSNEIGIKYPLSANDALAATLDLAKAGQEFADIQNILPSAADLASLSESGDLDAATKFLIAAEASFTEFGRGIEGTFDNADIAANAVFRAANVSTAAVDGLIEGLSIAAPTANRFNVSLQDTAAFLTLFEDAGIRGSQAGNLFSTVLGEISKPKARDELNRLRVAWQNQDGSLRDVSLILDDVQKRYEELGLTQVEVSNSLRELGGDKFGQQGLSIIFGRGGITGVREAMGDLRDETNSANKAAQDLLESLKGQINQLSGSFDTLLTKVFLPILNRFFLPLVKFARLAVDSLLSLPDVVTETFASVVGLLSTFASLAGAGLVFAGVVGQINAVFIGFVGALITSLTILPQLIAGFTVFSATLVAALPIVLLLGGAFLSFASIVTDVFRAIEDETTPLAKTFENLKEEFRETFEVLKTLAKDALLVIQTVFGDVFQQGSADRLAAVSSAFVAISESVKNLRVQLEGIDTEALAVFFIRVRESVFPLLQAVDRIGAGIFQILFGDFSGIERVKSGISDILYIATDFVGQITGIDFERALARFDAGKIRSGLENLFDVLREEFKLFVAQNSDKLTEIFGTIFQFVNPFQKASNLFGLLGLDNISDQFQLLSDILTNAFKGVFDIILTLLTGGSLSAAFERNFGELGKAFFRIAAEIGKSVELISVIVESFFDLFESSTPQQNVTNLSQVILNGFNAISGAIRQFNVTVLIPLRDNLPVILNQLTTLARQVIKDFAPMGYWIRYASEQFAGLFIALQQLFAGDLDFAGFFAELAGSLISIFATLPQAIGQTLINLGESLGNTFLVSLGEAFRGGNLIQFVGTVLQGVVAIFTRTLQRIPKFLVGIAEETGNMWLLALARALQQGDYGTVIRQIGGAIINVFRQALSVVFNTLVNLFDEWLDLFDNRIVGGFTLVLVSALVTAVGFLALQLPAIMGGLFPVVGVIGVSLANFLGLSFVSTLASGAWFLGAVAIIAGVLGTLIYTVFNDPDVLLTTEEIGRLYGKRVTLGLRDELVNSKVGDVLINAFSRLFSFAELTRRVGAEIEEFANVVEQKFINFVVSKLGAQFEGIATYIAGVISTPIELLGSSVVLIGNIIELWGNRMIKVVNNITYVFLLLRNVWGTITSTITNLVNGFIGLFQSAERLEPPITQVGEAVEQVEETSNRFLQTIITIGAAITTAVLVWKNWASIVGLVGRLLPVISTGLTVVISKMGILGVAVQRVANASKSLFAIVTVLAALKGAVQGANESFQNQENILSGLIRVITNMSIEIVKLFGFGGDLETQVRTTVDQLVFLAEYFGEQVGNFLSGIFDKLLVTIANIRSDVEIAAEAITGQTAVAARTFKLAQEALAGTYGEGASFWNTLLKTSDLDSVKALLRSNADELITEFNKSLQGGSDLEIGLAAGVLSDAGLLDEAIESAAGNLERLSAVYGSASLDEQFDIEATSDTARAFVEALISLPEDEIERVRQTNSSIIENAVHTIARDFEQGFLDVEQRDLSLEKLGFRFVDDVGIVRIEEAAAARNAAFDATVEVAEQASTAIDEFNQKLLEGDLTAEDYKNAVQTLAEELNKLIESTARERIGELNEQFSDGEITAREYRAELNELFDELETSAADQTAVALEALDRAFAQGQISSADYAAEVEQLESVLTNIANQRDVETEIADLRVAYQGGRLTEEEFRNEVQRVIDSVNEVRQAVGEEQIAIGFEVEEPDLPDIPEFEEPEALIVEQSAEEAEKEKEKIDAINEKYADKEEKTNDNIIKAREDYAKSIRKLETDAYTKRERAAEDHQKRLTEIAKSGAEGVIDAVAARDSAAAQSAVVRAAEETKQEQDQFRTDQIRAAEDLDQRKKEALERTQARIAEQQKRLEEIRADHAEELAELQAKNAEEDAITTVSHEERLAAEQEFTEEVKATTLERIEAQRAAIAKEIASLEEKEVALENQFEKEKKFLLARTDISEAEREKLLALLTERHQQELSQIQQQHTELLNRDKQLSQQLLTEADSRNRTFADRIRSGWSNIANAVNTAFSNMANSSNSFVSRMGQAGQSLMQKAQSFLSNIGSNIRSSFNRMRNSRSGFSQFANAASNIGNNILSRFGNRGGSTSSTGGGSRFGYRSSSFTSGSSSSTRTPSQIATAQNNLNQIKDLLRFGGTRHSGGNTQFGNFYRVGGPQPELYNEGGDTYLIPSRRGQVTPPSLAAPPRANPQRSQGIVNNNLEFSFDAGGMNFSGGDFNPDEIVTAVEKQIVPRLTNVLRQVRDVRRNQ